MSLVYLHASDSREFFTMFSLFKYDDYCVELPPSFLTFYSIS
ncbi:hypothetical protein FDUTEX481_07406 [Tolypothrix sp. PCC 7601]|nr:hypothetical protein FDUTEX481_07406 [Tolypothrix sp. PCC 7601]